MTKAQYFEMCEMLGNELVEADIPVELEDMYDEVQEAFSVYGMLQDSWDTMNGLYMGKVYSGIQDIMNIMAVEDQKTCLLIIKIIDYQRSKLVNSNKKKATK